MNVNRSCRSGFLGTLTAVVALWVSSVAPGIAVGWADEEKDAAEPALKGYCPAAYVLHGEARKGDPAHQMVYRGQVYHFASAEAKAKFESSPEQYHPQFAGLCTLALGGPYGNKFDGDPLLFEIVDGKVYLFSSERARRAYAKDPPKYIAGAERRWAQPELSGYCPVSYQIEGKATKGDAQFRVVHKTSVFHTASTEAMMTLAKDAERYLPRYDGFSATGVARNKSFPGYPPVFSVYEDRTYLFFDEEEKAVFDADPVTIIRQADENWPSLKDKKR